MQAMTTVTVGDAAYRLDVRPRAIYDLVEDGRLTLVEVDGRWVVREDDLPVLAQKLAR